MTYSRGKWAVRNMKLAQIDYLSTTGRPKSKPSTVEGEGARERAKKKKSRSTSCLFLPQGSFDGAITHQIADLQLEQLYPQHTRTELYCNYNAAIVRPMVCRRDEVFNPLQMVCFCIPQMKSFPFIAIFFVVLWI